MVVAEEKRDCRCRRQRGEPSSRRVTGVRHDRQYGDRVHQNLWVGVQARTRGRRGETRDNGNPAWYAERSADQERGGGRDRQQPARHGAFHRELWSACTHRQVRDRRLQDEAWLDEVVDRPPATDHLGRPRHVHEIFVVEIENQPADGEDEQAEGGRGRCVVAREGKGH